MVGLVYRLPGHLTSLGATQVLTEHGAAQLPHRHHGGCMHTSKPDALHAMHAFCNVNALKIMRNL